MLNTTLFFGPLLFANDQITITANSLLLDKKKHVIKATGKVKIKYQNIQISTSKILFNQKTNTLLANSKSIITFNEQSVLVDYLSINLKSRDSILKGLSGQTQNLRWKADQLSIKNDTGTFNNIFISPCQLNEPLAIYITCNKTTIDQSKETMQMEDNHLYLFNRKIFSIKKYRRGGIGTATERSGFGFPRIYKNESEGLSLVSTLPVFYSKHIYSTAEIGYTSKKGLKTGLEATYSPLKHHKFTSYYNVYSDSTPFRGISYLYRYPLNQTKSFNFSPIISPQKPQESTLDIFMNYSYNYYINFEEIDLLPELGLRLNAIQLPYNLLNHTTLSAAKINEESVSSKKKNIYNKLHYPLPKLWVFKNHIDFESKFRYYDNDQNWIQHYANLHIKNNTKLFKLDFILRKQIVKSVGESPFKFDTNTEPINDEIGLLLKIPFHQYSLGTRVDYDLKENSYRNVAYFFDMNLFCNTKVSVKFNTTWKTFSINVSIDKIFKQF